MAATVQYFFGRRRNRALAAERLPGPGDPAQAEPHELREHRRLHRVQLRLHPVLGSLGRAPRGTITLSPRQSLLYLPDLPAPGLHATEFFINLFTKKKSRARPTSCPATTLRRARIDGIEGDEPPGRRGGGKTLRTAMEGCRPVRRAGGPPGRLPGARAGIRHFCSYPDNKTFYLYTVPRGEDASGGPGNRYCSAVPRFLDTKKEV
ncbi:MAG: hypothetical protein M0C28_48780 [Candidatus Moduliflexus flocculans]|nr:hypothetical protein [Candidatus Moduliflexus flocculans]